MGLDVVFVVERLREDGCWERAEELIPNEQAMWYEVLNPDLMTLQAEFVHTNFYFDNRDRWLDQINWPTLRPVPEDMSRESVESLRARANDGKIEGMLLLRDLEETDWEACWNGWETLGSDPYRIKRAKEQMQFLRKVKNTVLDTLRPLGGLDDVRLIFGYNY